MTRTHSFSPIAIVGRACLLPGARTPAQLFELASAGRVVLSDAPPERWRVPMDHVLARAPGDALDRTWTQRGGYVSGFSFDAAFEHPALRARAADLAGLDPLVHWLVDTSHRALADAGVVSLDRGRTGAVVGNLSLPSSGSCRFAEQVWLGPLARRAGVPPTDPRDRFNSGLPAHLLASVLGLGVGSYALDAACASSLYAIEDACRALQEGRADRMLAGAVNRADDLFIHIGFCALGAMSKTGQSRPFHAGADGLVSAEGCGVVVLERLDDAVRAGRTIHGVIRGVGLANDGRGEGLLAPSARGQARSMELALQQAGLDAADVPYIECHATGTRVGDGTELSSMASVYARGAHIGSLKANLGHLITAAGVAGLIKALESLREGVFLPTPGLDERSPALLGSRFTALDAPEPWVGPRRAAVSAFGFGGNDAHLIVEAYEPGRAIVQVTVGDAIAPEVVVVAMGARVGDGRSVADLERVLLDGQPIGAAETVRIPMRSLRFPPNDLRKTSPQQTVVLSAALEATDGLTLPAETTGVFIGYGCDPEIGRWGARWRCRSWGDALGQDAAWASAAADAFIAPLESAHVVGSLPNIPANRLSSQLDLRGPSYTLSSEELSGIRGLERAVYGLRRGDLDAALVGAVDLSSEPVHRAAVADATEPPGDAAVVLVLRRRVDAEREGVPVLAQINLRPGRERYRSTLPKAHAASGLLEVASAIVCTARGRTPRGAPWGATERELSVSLKATGQVAQLSVSSSGPPIGPFDEASEDAALELPAHPPRIVLPPLTDTPPSRQRPTEESSMQTMPPAPALPPTTFDAPAPPPLAPPPFAPPPLAQGTSGWLAAHAAHQIRLADAHRAFLEHQTRLHQQFLAGLIRSPLTLPAAGYPRVYAPLPQAPLPQAPLAQAPLAQAPLPQAPLPQAPLPQAPLPQAPLSQARAPAPNAAAPIAQARAVEDPAPAVRPLAFRPRGPSFTREQLLVHSSGRVSDIFGELFARQDGYDVQVRMPEPPLLLADRVTGLQAEPGSMQRGTCWTETDVRADSWYLHAGHMPTGIMIESGQADLFLISYLGADFANRGERAYRLLGCEMRWLGDLPAVGETLVYDIHVDGHAAQGDVRLFFFHYDCHIRRPDGSTRPALEVRQGQAGFFTDEELADSAGIIWKPEEQEIAADARLDPPAVPVRARSFSREEVRAFAAARPWECFGDGFHRSMCHTRTPCIQDGRMLFLDTVEIDPEGGPWGRGYLKAVTPISSDDWFFDGHFKNDPCMPGTLMLEGCVQAMAFYLAAMGYTIERDGWRFVPIEDEAYALRCRGQVVPSSKELVYEVFVEELHDGPEPRLYADLLCTVDGLGAFHARRFGLSLKPDWPLTTLPALREEGRGDPRAATASYQGGPPFRFDYPSLAACAWGKPSDAFGPMYARFDGVRRTARLPGPPYHFLSRVTGVSGEIGGLEAGTSFELVYDIPEGAWYFDQNGARVMPFAVLLEAALQPCGWVASYVGSSLTEDSDLLFRNLDGTGTIKAEVFPDAGTLRTTVKIKSIVRSGGMIIESFEVRCYLGETEVYELDTVFGFFPPEAFVDQAGLPTSDRQRALFGAKSNVHIDLTGAPPRLCAGSLRLADPMLLMIDRVTLLDREGGELGLGCVRAEKDVDPGEWFFKAHFYQDPVQPGSLGIEAMLQAMQVFMLETGMGRGVTNPRFEAIATDLPHVWKYRGQVVPDNKVITTTVEIIEAGRDDRGPYALASASLWVDGKRIYEAPSIGMRIVEGGGGATELLDPAVDTWVSDHCPTYTQPALPMMSMLDRMMAAVHEVRPEVTGLRDLTVERWVVVDRPTRLRTEVDGSAADGAEVRLMVWRESNNPALSRFEVAARATIGGPSPFSPIEPLADAAAREPYADHRLFHGPAFHYATALSVGARGSSMRIDAGAGAVPFGHLHQGLLDAATHGILHDELNLWSDEIGDDVVGYPHRLDVVFAGPPPAAGEVWCESRFVGFHEDNERLPVFRVQLTVDEQVFVDMRLVEILMPKGPLGMAAPSARRRFLADRRPAPSVGLSRADGDTTVLTPGDVALSDWFPSTIRVVYGTDDPRQIAVAEHVARQTGAHPSAIVVRGEEAFDAHDPLIAHPVQVEEGELIVVRTDGAPRLSVSPVAEFWRGYFDVGPWPVEELYYALVEQFVARFRVEDPEALSAWRGRGVLYLGNHQVGIESLIFSIVASALQGSPTLTLAKKEHRTSWLGELIAHCFTWPGIEDPGVITYFDREDPTSLPRIVQDLAGRAGPGEDSRSLMVHVEGTRAHTARHRVEKMSGVFCDLAIAAGIPIVPVRFTGGLPVAPVSEKLEYPTGMGRQEYWLGAPIDPEELRALGYKARIERVVQAINALGPSADVETPCAPDPALAAAVEARTKRSSVPFGLATILELLRAREHGPEVAALLSAIEAGGSLGSDDAGSAASAKGRWIAGLADVFRKARL